MSTGKTRQPALDLREAPASPIAPEAAPSTPFATTRSRIARIVQAPAFTAVMLFLLASAARLALVETSRFTGDEILTWQTAHGIVTSGNFPLLGPIITNGPARLPGPLTYDLLAIPLYFNQTPDSANAFVALLGAGGVVIYWAGLRKFFGASGALLGGLMMACSPWSTLYADRVWNPNIIQIFLSLAFYAACSLRKRPTAAMVILLMASSGAVLQLHMSAPMVWLSLVPIFAFSLRKWKWYWGLAGIVVALALFTPMFVSELRTHWANTKSFLHDAGGAGDPNVKDWQRVPLWAFRMLTLDVTYHQLHFYWGGPQPEADMLKFIVHGNEDFHYGPVRWTLLGLSVVFAIAAIVVFAFRFWDRLWRRSPHGFVWAALVGLCANTLLLGATHKEVFGHYVQPLLPLYFVAFAELGRWAAPRRAPNLLVWGAAIVVCAGGIDAATWVSRTMDARNGLATVRAVTAAIRADQPNLKTIGLSANFGGGSRFQLEAYNAVASLHPNEGLHFTYGNQYLLEFREEPPPPGGRRLVETSAVVLYRMK